MKTEGIIPFLCLIEAIGAVELHKSCNTVPRHAVPCYAMLRHASPCDVMLLGMARYDVT